MTEARSDAEGSFVLDGLGEGPFLVLASHDDLDEASVTLVEPDRASLELELEERRTLAVTVQREGRPVEATIELVTVSGQRRQEPTAGGQALVQGLSNEWTLVWAHAGRLASVPRWLRAPPLPTEVTLHLWETAPVQARVVDEAGRPVPSAKLLLSFDDHSTALQERGVDRDGRATFASVGPGPYTLEAVAEGFETATLETTIPNGGTLLKAVMRPQRFITGRVLDRHGRGVPDAWVRLAPSEREWRTDAQGRFSLEAGHEVDQVEAYHSDWGRAVQRVSQQGEAVTLTLEPGATLAVHVTSRGRPVEGAKVVVSNARDVWYPEVSTLPENSCLVPVGGPKVLLEGVSEHWSLASAGHSGSDGWIELRGLPAGAVEVWVSHPDHPFPLRRLPLVVDLQEGQRRRVDMAFPHGGRMNVELVDVAGRPISGALVSAVGQAPPRTDVNGRSSVRGVPEGQALVQVSHPDFALAAQRELEVWGEQVTHARFVLTPLKRYRGRVVRRDGRPLYRFTVNRREFFDPTGHFEVPIFARGGRSLLDFEVPGLKRVTEAVPEAQTDVGTITL